jgi:hypothetical protein
MPAVRRQGLRLGERDGDRNGERPRGSPGDREDDTGARRRPRRAGTCRPRLVDELRARSIGLERVRHRLMRRAALFQILEAPALALPDLAYDRHECQVWQAQRGWPMPISTTSKR